MRQNTRVIHASSMETEDDDNGPPRPGHSRTKSWSVEPWRNSARRRSHRDSTGASRKKPPGAAPPLPSKDGKNLPIVDETEDESRSSLNSQFEDGTERGRLFVKVIGVKDLVLPLPQGTPSCRK